MDKIKRIRMMALCALGVLAWSALAAVSASATPVLLYSYKECSKAEQSGQTYLGHYANKNCTAGSKVGTGGKYELVSPAGKQFTLRTASGQRPSLYFYFPANEEEARRGGTVVDTVVCRQATGWGEFTSESLYTSTITFRGCSLEGKKCTPPIKSFTLDAEPVLEEGQVLLLTYPASGKTPPHRFLEFRCDSQSVEILGGTLSSPSDNVEVVANVSHNTMTANATTGEPGFAFYEGPGSGEQHLVL